MQKSVIIAVVIGVAIAAVYALTRPEPTPSEKLAEAAQDAGEAAKDALDDLAGAADEAATALRKEVESKTEELQAEAESLAEAFTAELSEQSAKAQEEMEKLQKDWRATGIVTDDGIDFNAAIAAIEKSDLDDDSKKQLTAVIEFLRDTPGEAKAKLDAFEATMEP